MPRIPGILESVDQPLYDQATLTGNMTAPQFQATFFQVPLGGTAPGSSTPKTQVQTNMDQGGSLPYPKNFEIHAIRMVNQFGATITDLNTLYMGGWFRLFIGTKDYLVVNAFMLTAGVGLDGVLTGSTNTVSVVNGRPDQRATYVLAEPIDLIPQQNFRCELNFPSGLILLNSPLPVSILLMGFLKREVH